MRCGGLTKDSKSINSPSCLGWVFRKGHHKYTMDFLCFTTNHGIEHAMNLAEIVAVIEPGPITGVPGTPKGIVGVLSFRGELIPVVDVAELYHNKREPANLMLIVQSKEKYGILIKSVSDIVRGKVPSNVKFIDPYDYERSVLGLNKDTVCVELF